MKVSIVRGGGIAGLVTTTSADTAELAPGHAQELRDRVARAGLFSLPEQAAAAGPDRHTYRLTVEDGARTHTVRLREEDLTADVQSLITWVQTVPGHQERIGPPGR